MKYIHACHFEIGTVNRGIRMRFFDIFNKQYLKRTLITLGSAALALGIIFYISFHLADSFENPLGLQNAVYVDQSKTISADGYILREETVLYASSSQNGSVTPAVGDGQRLARYDRAADIYEGTSPDIIARMEEIDSQLTLLEKSEADDVSQVNTSGLDAAIFRNVQDIRGLVENGAYGEAVSLRASFLVNIKKREILGGSLKDYSAQIALLKQEKNALKAQLGTCLETYYTPQSGYYYSPSAVDGYESIFASEKLSGMTYEEFSAMITEEPAKSTRYTQCVGKLVTDFRWYLACPVTKAEAAEMEDGGSYTVVFPYNGNKSLRLQLDAVIPELPGTGAVAVFVCESIPEDFDYTRMQPVQIFTAEYRGFSVPVSAVRMLEGYQGVYVLDEITVDFRRIQIVYEGDGYYICVEGEADPQCPYGWLRMNDVIITEGVDLEVGKVVG